MNKGRNVNNHLNFLAFTDVFSGVFDYFALLFRKAAEDELQHKRLDEVDANVIAANDAASLLLKEQQFVELQKDCSRIAADKNALISLVS